MIKSKKIIAEVVPAVKLPRNVSQIFSYALPPKMEKEIKIGKIVEIPFRNKNILGVVLDVKKEVSENIKFKLKEISSLQEKDLYLSDQQIQLAKFISTYYYTPLSLVIKAIVPPLTKNKPRKKINLNYNCKIPDIKKTEINKLLKKIEKKNKVLLIHNLQAERHNLYSEIIKKNIKAKAQTLILFPEYFDIYNFADFYKNKFKKEKIAILTSELTKNQYSNEWEKIKSANAQIIIGTRQALFAPFRNLKLIICDDENNSSYKQWDQNPRYHGIKTAQKLAEIFKAKIILSSTAPSVESYYLSKDPNQFSKIEYITKKFARNIDIVNMENDRKTGNYSALSERLKENLLKNIYNKKQAIIFIPRLGKNTITKCRDCEYIAQCKNCENILILQNNFLYCTRCKEKTNLIKQCPKCEGQRMNSFGYGSEEIQNETEKLFEGKNIKIVRLDSSTTQKGTNQNKIQTDFINGKIDILIGTQMVLKNWNMENISTFAILFPEIIFTQSEFRSKEKTIQFLKFISNQINKSQKIILQTNDIENKMFSYLKSDLNDFYTQEIKSRKLPSGISYPPFSQLIKLIYKNNNQLLCRKEAETTYRDLKIAIEKNERLKNVFQITSPFPASNFIEYGKYRQNMIIKSICSNIKDRNSLLEIIKEDWIIDIDPYNIS